MKKIVVLVLLITCLGKVFPQSQEAPEFWENEKLNEYNRQSMHATYFAFENKNLTLKDDMQQSKYFFRFRQPEK
jgi:beta-galactosidase